eukprot:Tbor_TRINITY_DN5194_c1_g19::TRINITY_DN5194_c1_g19_i1::g.26207::m.26207/K00128/ALDH; aldehyde dehydrogenase (NAD+)
MDPTAAPLVKDILRTNLFINGQYVAAVSGKTMDVENPHNGGVIVSVAEGDMEDVDLAVQAALSAFQHGSEWREMDAVQRGTLLNKLAALLERDLDKIAHLEAIDGGKPIGEAKYDTEDAIRTIRYYAGWADKYHGKTIPIAGNHLSITKKEPVGVVGQIVPFNFPLLMALWKIAPALACGCTIVLKPAEQTPLTTLYLGELMNEAGFPPGVLNIVTGYGVTTGAAITEHPSISKVAFTGSTSTGKLLMSVASKTLKRVSLELGGKSPLVIFNDADLDSAIEAADVGTFYNQGQVCSASSRILVQSGVYDRFLEKMVERTKQKKQGGPFVQGVNIGPLVSKVQFDRVMALIQKGKEEGARCVLGGDKTAMVDLYSNNDGSISEMGYFVQPTIFADVTNEMHIAREEIFGPVMCVIKFETTEDALFISNDTQYGLASSVFTENIETAYYYANRIKAGTVWINTYNVFDPAQPFGGFKNSGFGRELGECGMGLYTEEKVICLALKHKP